MKHTTLVVACCLFTRATLAQDIGGFLDYRNYFFVFDKGTITELEALPPRAFASGGNYLVYASSNGDLKIYDSDGLRTIDQNIATVPMVTDHNFGYISAGIFRVYDGERLNTLSTSAGPKAFVEDSVAGFYDTVQRTVNLHYRGTTIQVEDALIENPLQGWSAGDNTVAWVSAVTSELKVFQHGDVYVLASQVRDIPFVAGLDVVAYQDPSDLGLKAYYKGEVLDVDPFMPEKIHMGRGLFAYIDRSGSLMVFQGGRTHTALSYTPEEIYVRDSVIVMKDQGQFKVYANGNTEMLLPYWPQRWEAGWGTIVWVDDVGDVQSWQNGQVTTVMRNEPVRDLLFQRGLLTLILTNNSVRILWNGDTYEH